MAAAMAQGLTTPHQAGQRQVPAPVPAAALPWPQVRASARNVASRWYLQRASSAALGSPRVRGFAINVASPLQADPQGSQGK